MGAPIELSTEDKLEYQFHPVSSGSLSFKVRAGNDAHVALTSGPGESDPMYEIFIGGWGNTKSVIRYNRQKPEKAEADTPEILNGGEFRGFWIRWHEGIVTVGREGEAAAFLTWEDPNPFPIGYYGVCTGWGASGSWIIESGPEFTTSDCLEYSYKPLLRGTLDFDFCGPSNSHIALTSGPKETDPMYEIILGGWNNTASVLRYRKEQPDKVRKDTPSLLSANEYRRFTIEWNNGLVTVHTGNHNGPIILEWRDPKPFQVTHVGVRTGWGATGRWRLRICDQRCPSNRTPGQQLPPGAQTATAGGWSAPMMSGGGGGGSACWVDARGGEIPPNAVSGGTDGEPLYIGRAQHEGALIPGKIVPSHGVCYIPWAGDEHGKAEYQVLCGCAANWVPVSGPAIPPGALPAGETEEGEPLFVGRASHEGTLTVGKVQPSHGVCYIPYAGKELGFDQYEILVAQ